MTHSQYATFMYQHLHDSKQPLASGIQVARRLASCRPKVYSSDRTLESYNFFVMFVDILCVTLYKCLRKKKILEGY